MSVFFTAAINHILHALEKKIVLIFTDLLNDKLEGTLEVIKSNPIVLQISNGLTERKCFFKDHLINHPPKTEVWFRSAGT